MAGLNIRVTRDKRKPASKQAMREYLHKQLETVWRACVRAFIHEAISHVHVDTGMSEASFYDLATNVRIANQVIADIAGKGPDRPKPPYTDLRGVVHSKTKKSIPLGQELGSSKKAYHLLFGSPRNPQLVFEFKIVIFQYKLHEFGYQTPPWQSLEYGRFAFIAEWHEQIRKQNKAIINFLVPK